MKMRKQLMKFIALPLLAMVLLSQTGVLLYEHSCKTSGNSFSLYYFVDHCQHESRGCCSSKAEESAGKCCSTKTEFKKDYSVFISSTPLKIKFFSSQVILPLVLTELDSLFVSPTKNLPSTCNILLRKNVFLWLQVFRL